MPNIADETVTTAQVYEMTWETVYKDQTPAMQKRIQAAKGDDNNRDPQVAAFVKKVVAIADEVLDDAERKAARDNKKQ